MVDRLDATDMDVTNCGDRLGRKPGEVAAEQVDALEFVVRWAWRVGPLTDAERLSAIKFHPTIKRVAERRGYPTGDQNNG